MYLSSLHIVPRQYSGFTTMLQELESSATRNKVGALKSCWREGDTLFLGVPCVSVQLSSTPVRVMRINCHCKHWGSILRTWCFDISSSVCFVNSLLIFRYPECNFEYTLRPGIVSRYHIYIMSAGMYSITSVIDISKWHKSIYTKINIINVWKTFIKSLCSYTLKRYIWANFFGDTR